MMITSKRAYKDSFVRRTRVEPMMLPAELLRAFLPPRTIGNGHVISTAVLEPAYEIGGDAFDHSLTDTTLHATVLDAMGHNLASGLTSAVSLAACRNARRTGADLPELVDIVPGARRVASRSVLYGRTAPVGPRHRDAAVGQLRSPRAPPHP